MDTEQSVNLALLYNPFDPTDIVREELLYQDGKKLNDYLVGLPKECDWKVGLNCVPVEEAAWEITEILPEDTITLIAMPRGGQNGKQILRMVALLAIVVAAMYFLGPGAFGIAGLGLTGTTLAAAVAVTAAVGGFLVNMLIPAGGLKQPKDDGNSYGFDGAKNTSKEGTPIPVIYGQFQVAGNYVDLFTENVGDTQYLYGRVVLSDGEIDSVVGDPLIDQQDISTYKDVQWGYTTGSASDAVNTHFNGSKQQFPREDLLTTSYIQYDTTAEVDGFEIDLMFPQGLTDINTKTGDKGSRSVTVEIQYTTYGSSNWTNTGTTSNVTSGYTAFSGTSPTATKFAITTQGDELAALNGTATYTLQYKLHTDITWTTYQTYTDSSTSFSSAPSLSGSPYTGYDVYTNNLPDGYTYTSQFSPRTIYLTLPSGAYDFQITGSGSLVTTATLPADVAPGSGGVSASTTVTYTDARTITIRKTYKSPTLPRARYSIRFRRTVASDPSHPDWVDELHCTGVTEVNNSNVTLRNIATGWYVAKMTDQLANVPNITWKVKGEKVDIYDVNGNVTATQWSDNPADIVLDMLISQARGPLRDKIKIDFPAFVDWRTYCTAQGLKFNAVFDSFTTLWDSLQNVFKIGHGFPVRAGTRLSVGVDRPATPTMVFGSGNIFKDTFSITYLALQDRANEFEVTYYDATDSNKSKIIRIADPQAAQSGEIPKTASYELVGIDNFTQAQNEVWYQLYNNRLSRRVVSFDAPIESIGLNLGDVAYITHDMVDWADSGRLITGTSTTQVTLDKDVTLVSGNTYTLLINHSTVQKATCNISLVTGTTYNLSALSSTSAAIDTLKRLQTNTGDEAEVLSFTYTGGSNATVTLSDIVSGSTATLWDVDVVEERTVTTAPSETNIITVSSGFSITPEALSNYMIGINTVAKRPYRLSGITGDNFDQRTLTFVEYNEYIYSPPETTIPAPAINPSVFPTHVKNLSFTIDPLRTSEGAIGYLSWSSGSVLNYAGADIYVSINGSDYTFLATATNSNNYTVKLQSGSSYSFKVNAFNSRGMRANVNTAPIANKDITTAASSLVEPTGLTWTLDKINTFAQGWVSWTQGDPLLGNVSPHTRVQVKYAGTSDWLDKGLTDQTKLQILGVPAGTHSFQIRAENGTGQISSWVSSAFTITVPTLVAPTLANDGTAIDHVINADSSADISLEWLWAGTESEIDGFEVIRYTDGTSVDYVIGTSPSFENHDRVPADKRAVIYQGTPANVFYTFYVRAFKRVDSSFAAAGVLYSTAVKSTATGEHPYQPSTSVAFTGDIVGTLNTADINLWSAISGAGKPEDGADVTRWINNPPQRLSFKYDYTGAAQTGEFSRDLTFDLMNASGVIGSSVTWSYLLISGGINSKTNADGSQSMTGTGEGTLTVSTLDTSVASVQVTATYSGKPYTLVVTLTQDIAAAPIDTGSGGGSSTIASKSSGFNAILDTTVVDITGALNGTMPAGKTTANVNVSFDAEPIGSSNGTWSVNLKVMRDISGTPTQIGTTQTHSSHYGVAYGGPDPASFLFSIPDTGLTAGVSYTWRVYGFLTSGARSHNITGTVTVTV